MDFLEYIVIPFCHLFATITQSIDHTLRAQVDIDEAARKLANAEHHLEQNEAELEVGTESSSRPRGKIHGKR